MRKTSIAILVGFELPATENHTWGAVIPGDISGLLTAGNDFHELLHNLQEVVLLITESRPLTLADITAIRDPNNMYHDDTVPGFYYTHLLLEAYVADGVDLDFDALAARDRLRDIDAELRESMAQMRGENKFDLFKPSSPSTVISDYIDDPDSPLYAVFDQSQLDAIAADTLTIDLALAKRMAKACDTSVEFWLGVDHQYRLYAAREIDAESNVQ